MYSASPWEADFPAIACVSLGVGHVFSTGCELSDIMPFVQALAKVCTALGHLFAQLSITQSLG